MAPVGAFQGALVVKDLCANAGDTRDCGLIPGSGRSPGEGTGNPLEYSCLGNPLDRGAWWATVHGAFFDHFPSVFSQFLKTFLFENSKSDSQWK